MINEKPQRAGGISQKNNGGPAFPRPLSQSEHNNPTPTFPQQDGMSLRDWFAGQAMSSMCAQVGKPSHIATYAYELADAMIEQRAK